MLDASLDANHGGHGMNSGLVKCRAQADRLREFGDTVVSHSVQRLAPPHVGGNVEPGNGGGFILHLRGLLLEGHALHQIRGPLLRRQGRIQVGSGGRVLRECG